MTKTLEVKFPNRCVGCELCVFEVQRQLDKVGLEGSFIRIFRAKNPKTKNIEFSIETDPHIGDLDVEKIKGICPNGVFGVGAKKE